ncbi:UNVERIFIED_CONTAM: protein CHROMATIN REMODELING 20 [Sesamum radiatum]|uniref:Protein CHROMATIN REMODELING 20 n=1 Tax=Sesamum radiatum TaxID=300843 RepID=A0AAW2NAP4_SESRA
MDAAEEREKDEEEIAHDDNDCSDDSLEEEGGEDEVEEEVKLCSEEPLTEEEIEVLIAELLEVESKAAEAQEALEEESLMRVEADVRKELALSLSDNELDKAVVEEMFTFKEEWEVELDELETDSAYLLEQLDSAGIELSSLYKWIERQVPNGCCTEAWKKRTHWVGIQMSLDATESVAQAEEYLQIHRPVTRRHGKIFETGASGFLGKKDAMCGSNLAIKEIVDADWDWFSRMCSEKPPSGDVTFGSNHWASVYLASTPQQAAELGLKFPGVNEVEEIDDVDGTSSDPFVADAIANERNLSLTEEQKRNFRKVKEEDDATDDLKLHIHMKPWRRRKRCKEDSLQGDPSSTDGLKASQPDFCMTCEDGIPEDDNGHRQLNNNVHELSNVLDKEKANVSNDNEAPVAGNESSLHTEEVSKFEGDIASSSDSGSDDSDADSVNSRYNRLQMGGCFFWFVNIGYTVTIMSLMLTNDGIQLTHLIKILNSFCKGSMNILIDGGAYI